MREIPSDLRIIIQSLGMVFIVVGVLSIAPLLICAYYREPLLPFLLVTLIPMLGGMLIARGLKGEIELHFRHAAVAAALTYLVASLLGALPFMYYGMSFLDSLFEAMSGWTTTGLTMIGDVESMPKSLLFWRSFMQWLGGIGVIVLMLVILAGAGSAAARLYEAEARRDRIKPRLISTVRLIWWIYLSYTVLGVLLYFLAGMNLFDAINHTMATLSTGGFSTRNMNIQSFSSQSIELVTMLLMLLGATNFLVHYKILTGNRRALLQDVEARTLYLLAFAGALILTLRVPSFRHSLFQAISSISTTGASSIDVSRLDDFSKLLLSFMMMVGASTGSTGGGFKIIRLVIVVKLIWWWMEEKFLPEHAVITKKVSGIEIGAEELQEASVFLLLYLFIYSFGVLLLVFTGYPVVDSIFEVVSAQSNVGLSTGITGVALHSAGKLLLIFDMWIGRLEILPVFLLIESLLSGVKRGKGEEL